MASVWGQPGPSIFFGWDMMPDLTLSGGNAGGFYGQISKSAHIMPIAALYVLVLKAVSEGELPGVGPA
jgi:hypothetical protein